MLALYLWISVNAIVMEVMYDVSGHIIVILFGLPILIYLVTVTREKKIEWLMSTTTEKMNNDIDSLN